MKKAPPANYPEENGTSGWEASLDLRFACRGQGTVLVGRSHRGPLRIQKPLYPEGPDCCHAIILHPPGGIVGGDALSLQITAECGSKALITTPGAAKWYRSGGRLARQKVRITVADGGAVEWLPQESIFFDGTDACQTMEVELAPDATFLSLETNCLGRMAAGEVFNQGSIGLQTRIIRNGDLLWSERGRLIGSSPWLTAAAGLAGYPYCATLLAIGPGLDKALLEHCRKKAQVQGTHSGVTQLSGDLLVARCLGHNAEPLREWFLRIWAVLRPALLHRPALMPRLWNT